MKFTTTFLALFAAVAVLDQADARVGGDRDLVGRNKKYTVYFANSCNKKVDVTANSHSEVIPPNNCHVFNGGKQYYDSFSYKESGSGEKGGQVSCKNVGSSNNDKCNLIIAMIDTEVIPRTSTYKPALAFLLIDVVNLPRPNPLLLLRFLRLSASVIVARESHVEIRVVADNTTCTKPRGTACWVKEKCTKFCDAGQACGNSCISKKNTCSKTPDEGFACNTEDY
ncbi:hypothetical protein FRACYDRAFT_246044 [Fragilariopsis cylindrus CCMP1102]|uniref:Uncharacterized protein n=1 Tax=Fragilariopsis cylindrus CCMP1102 TaxID=635003 RepID=A0A1E7EZZ9_9STRA|nr:hypothetical protein FRACYDRAFT_246044 [Fragilariopsis cylindrus CCMP1102]|eukprot:OEU11436.1 hypothetical protein FRACYDRAFT_246044 [Fragilariopsis cylindrus CCMP1102]